jgi:hypothetical protein
LAIGSGQRAVGKVKLAKRKLHIINLRLANIKKL